MPPIFWLGWDGVDGVDGVGRMLDGVDRVTDFDTDIDREEKDRPIPLAYASVTDDVTSTTTSATGNSLCFMIIKK